MGAQSDYTALPKRFTFNSNGNFDFTGILTQSTSELISFGTTSTIADSYVFHNPNSVSSYSTWTNSTTGVTTPGTLRIGQVNE